MYNTVYRVLYVDTVVYVDTVNIVLKFLKYVHTPCLKNVHLWLALTLTHMNGF